MADEIDLICNDMFKVCSRLFNHRAVLQAESRYLVRELESKKSRDCTKAFQDIAQTTEKLKSLIPECAELLDEKIQTVHSHVVKAASSGLDILKDRSEAHEKIRSENKAKRDLEWEQFMVEMSKAQSNVLQKHEERMAEIHSHLEVKNIGK